MRGARTPHIAGAARRMLAGVGNTENIDVAGGDEIS